jgi:oligoribonuclease NrnB/cAMP/cGMP phosphodiesterase (DHH superfamily)
MVYHNCIQVKFVDYGDVDAEIRKFLETVKYTENDPSMQSVLLVSDITPTEETCEQINQVYAQGRVAVGCYDHHKDKEELLGRYIWGHYRPDCCGTKILYNVFNADEHGHAKLELWHGVDLFAQAIDAYDRWQLQDPERDRGEKLNRLLHFLGIKTFVYEFSQQIMRDQMHDFGYINSRLLDQEEERLTKALSVPLMFGEDWAGRLFGVLVATGNASQLGHRTLGNHPMIAYAVIINPVANVISLRSRQGEVDVSEIAKQMNPTGGGHQAAAGFSFDMGCARRVVEALKVGLGNSY